MMAAGEIMPEFVREENDEQRDRKGQPREEKGRVKVSQTECLKEGVEGSSLIVSIGRSEMRAGDERSE